MSPEADQAAAARVDWQVLEGVRVPALVEAAQLARHFAIADPPARRVGGQSGKLAAEFVEAQAQFQERPGVHLDGDLLDREAGELDGVHAPGEQFVLHLLGERNQLVQAARAGHQYRRHQLPVAEDVDVGGFDVRREAAHLGDALLHRVHEFVDVRARLHSDFHQARGVARDAPHGLDARHGLELLFERRGDQLLHVLRAGAPPGDRDVRKPLRLHGIETDVEPADGPNAGQHHQSHPEVGGKAMSHEDADQVHGLRGVTEEGPCAQRTWTVPGWLLLTPTLVVPLALTLGRLAAVFVPTHNSLISISFLDPPSGGAATSATHWQNAPRWRL